MRSILPSLVAIFGLLLAGCSHHAEHHARGEEHWHNAVSIDEAHDYGDEHRQDSHPDTFHGH